MSVPAYSAERPAGVSWRERAPAGARGPLLLAAGCLLAMAIVWTLAEHVPGVQARDARLLYRMTLLDRPSIEAVGHLFLHALEPALFVAWSSIVVAVAVFRRRPGRALAAVMVLGLSPLTAEVLKPLLAHPHFAAGGVRIGPASWPSGHASAALALAGAAWLVSPPRLRPLVAGIGAGFVAGVGLALLILAWHMPSDVLGGYLVATLWLSLALAVARGLETRAGAPAA